MNNQEKTSYLSGLLLEKTQIEAKDGMFTSAEQKRLDQINQIQRAEPELQNLLVSLDKRQQQEKRDLLQHHRRLINEQAPDSASIFADHNPYAEMEERHDQERERYIRDYQQAAELRREMNEKPFLSIDNKLTR